MEQIEIKSPKQKCLEQALSLRVGIDFLKISLAESWANFFRKSLARGMSVVQACETTTKW